MTWLRLDRSRAVPLCGLERLVNPLECFFGLAALERDQSAYPRQRVVQRGNEDDAGCGSVLEGAR
jgi:hypothetical protein